MPETTLPPRFFTYAELHQPVTTQEVRDDASAYWYAFGRLDQGHPPVVAQLHAEDSPSDTSTAWLFGSMWMQAEREFRDNDHPRNHLSGMQRAWDNFVYTGGHSIDHR